MTLSVDQLTNALPPFIQKPDPLIYLSNNYVVLDFETTNKEKGNPYLEENSIVLSVWLLGPAHPEYEKDNNLYDLRGNEYDLAQLVEHINQADFIVAHNAKFELAWLARCGLQLEKTLPWCTQIGEYVTAGNRKWKLSLEECARRRGWVGKDSLISMWIKAGVCPSEMPPSWLLSYCKQDVHLTHKLFLDQRRRLTRTGKIAVQFTRCILTPVLADIEGNGLHLDKDRVLKVTQRHRGELAEAMRRLDAITGGINPNSPKQVGQFLYEELKFPHPKDYYGNPILTKSGNLPTSAEIVEKLKAKTKRQRQFIAARKEVSYLNACMTKALNKFEACVTETDNHLLYAQPHQTRTATHRLSSEGRNYSTQFQNLHRIFKPLFSPRHDGWKIGEGDEGQLEYRVAVFLGQDEAGIYDIEHDIDAHAFTASFTHAAEWNKVKDDLKSAVRKAIRTDAKADTFKPLYGGSSGTPAQQQYYKAFKEKHKGITQMQEDWKNAVLKNKKLTTVTGLEFYWPDTKLTRTGYITNSTSICNYQVQMLATADIVPVAVVYQWHYMKAAKMHSFLVNTVHDSTISEIHPDEIELFEKIVVQCFTDKVIWYLNEVYSIDFNIKLEAEIEINDYWADSENWKQEFLQQER